MRKNSKSCCRKIRPISAIAIILAASMLMGTTGCETVRRKFVRKKKAKPIRPVFYKETEGELERPPVELYMTHYVYWKTWMNDLVQNAGQNQKSDERACNEVISNLLDMKSHLIGEKEEELAGYINDVKLITDQIKAGSVNDARMSRLRHDLGKIKARIARKFYYKKVRDHIKQ